MGYLLYTISVSLLALAIVLYFTRLYWLPYLQSSTLYTRLPTSFTGDIEAGLSSSDFDLNSNVAAGDSRAGLDEAGKQEVLKIMKRRGVGFDEARRILVERRFGEQGIGPDGRPRDPKFVSFS